MTQPQIQTDPKPNGTGATASPAFEPSTDTTSPEQAYLSGEAIAFALECKALRDVAYARKLGGKSGKRLARAEFNARVDALRTTQ